MKDPGMAIEVERLDYSIAFLGAMNLRGGA